MRTLLNEPLPPHWADTGTISRSEEARLLERTFSQNPVLTNPDDLVEVGLGGTVMATPGAENPAPARGTAFCEFQQDLSGSQSEHPEESASAV